MLIHCSRGINDLVGLWNIGKMFWVPYSDALPLGHTSPRTKLINATHVILHIRLDNRSPLAILKMELQDTEPLNTYIYTSRRNFCTSHALNSDPQPSLTAQDSGVRHYNMFQDVVSGPPIISSREYVPTGISYNYFNHHRKPLKSQN